jgi:hypothetical protein
MYTDSRYSNRNPERHQFCYIGVPCGKYDPEGDKNSIDNFMSTVCHCEHTPIWTYRFGQFIYPIYDELKLPFWREIIICELIKILYLRGINRYIFCEFDYMLVDNDTTKPVENKPKFYENIKKQAIEAEAYIFNSEKNI